jgi:hypothetical protein
MPLLEIAIRLPRLVAGACCRLRKRPAVDRSMASRSARASHSEPCTIIFSPSDTALGGYAALVLLLRPMITVTRRTLSAFGSTRPVDHECHYQGECWHGDQHPKYDISHLCNLVGIGATVVPGDTSECGLRHLLLPIVCTGCRAP